MQQCRRKICKSREASKSRRSFNGKGFSSIIAKIKGDSGDFLGADFTRLNDCKQDRKSD
jgi:hypothetical protein